MLSWQFHRASADSPLLKVANATRGIFVWPGQFGGRRPGACGDAPRSPIRDSCHPTEAGYAIRAPGLKPFIDNKE